MANTRRLATTYTDDTLRLDPARARHTGGCGLGLSIAGAMARLNNGDLALFNREGGGLCARLLLRA